MNQGEYIVTFIYNLSEEDWRVVKDKFSVEVLGGYLKKDGIPIK